MKKVQVAVVGGGIAGAATARALAAAGVEVDLFEQYALGHTRGSSHGTSRIFRYSYAEPEYVRDCMESLPLWRELQEEAGETLYTPTGGFDIGDRALAHQRSLEAAGAEFELLDAGEAARRYPGVEFPDGIPLLFQPDGGITHAERCVRACAAIAVRHGATLRERARVERLEPTGDSVVVHTSDESFVAEAVVVAAGSWAPGLLATCGIDLPVTATRETVVYFAFAEEVVPSLVDWSSEPAFFALGAPGEGLKAGWHHAGPAVVNPDEAGRPDPETVEAIVGWVRERFPAAGSEPLRAETCLYTNSADESFVFGREGRVVVVSACSGHGFKFGPLTGRRAADLTLEVL
ncbi:MAG TPA: FAD-dependent oxidoreductase [Actinomycetota bacterium]|nr:FAD-dependent oxidoreductase [Actinomycetota bacterium]